MSPSRTAKLFTNGGSQAVRLPKEFRFPGDRVRIHRVKGGILLAPVSTGLKEWFARIDAAGDEPFIPQGRNQPKMPKPKLFK